MKKLLFGAFAVLGLFSTQSGQAADLSVYKAPAARAPALTWTGCFVGGSAGGAWGESRHVNSSGAAITPDFDLSGAVVGGGWGCNFQMGQWVFGIESDISWTNKRGSVNNVPAFNAGIVSETRERWLSTSRARTGMAFERWLVYATYGLAVGSIEANMTLPGGAFAAETHTRFGWTVGGGVETKLTPAWSVKAEYLYVNFDWRNYFTPAPPGFADRGGGVPVTDHILRLGANYHFNWGW